MLISVVMASYNYSQFLTDAIKSVISQTFTNWELIIVDDGSTDKSVSIAKEFCSQDKRIKLFTHENNENRGLIETLKLGISKSQGEWIAFLECDDLWVENCLEKRVKQIENNSAALIFNDVEFIGEKSEKLLKIRDINRKFLNSTVFPRNMFFDFGVRNRILTFSSVIVKREVFDDFNWNSPSAKLFDWWTYIHLAYKNKFAYIDEKLTKWRIHNESFINKGQKTFVLNILAYIDVFKKYPSAGLFLFIPFAFIGFIVRKIFEKF